MRLNVEIEEITKQEAYSENGTGEWGTHLDTEETHAWQCPMLGDGGSGAGNQNDLLHVLSMYAEADKNKLYPEDGPDELLWSVGGRYFLATIAIE